jgi:N-dimethylarginine dimethylaminohydrolase
MRLPNMPSDQSLEARWNRIRTAMEQNRAVLEHHGTITVKKAGRATVRVLRFCERRQGRRWQRSIYLGADAELVRRAIALLEAFREPLRWQAETAAAAAALGSIASRLRRRMGKGKPARAVGMR